MRSTAVAAAPASGHGKPIVRKGVPAAKPLKSIPTDGYSLQSFSSDFSKPRSSGDFQTSSHVGGATQVLELYGKVAKDLRDQRYSRETVGRIVALNRGLKTFGPQLEASHKDVLDRYQVFLRNACRDGTLDLVARLQLLEIIELRAMKWKANDNVTNYYRNKMLQVEQCEPDYFHNGPAAAAGEDVKNGGHLNANATEFRPVVDSAKFCASATASLASMLAVEPPPPAVPSVPPGRVMVSSGKYDKPTRIPGKQQLKDEVVIRNSDSGKVEAGCKDRLVQVIGSDEATIELAKSLIEDTIQGNASPEPVEVTTSLADTANNNNNNWMMQGKAGLDTFTYTVEVGGENIKVLGGNAEVVRAAKIALDEYFAKTTDNKVVVDKQLNSSGDSTDAICQTDRASITYDRRRLLAYSASPLCRKQPTGWTEHWTNGLKAELGRNFDLPAAPASPQVEDGNPLPPSPDWFVPEPEKFMSANARFPPGFVRLPAHYRHVSQNWDGGADGGGVSHLDRLFTAGARAAAQPQRTTTALERLLATSGKQWDEAKGQWVAGSVATAGPHYTRK